MNLTKHTPAAMPHLLQGLTLPEPELCTDISLYLRLHWDIELLNAPAQIQFGASGVLFGDTYYNLFNIGKWQDRCALKALSLQVEGQGSFELTVWLAKPDGHRSRVLVQIFTLNGSLCLDIPLNTCAGPGVLHYEFRARAPGWLSAINWVTRQAPLRLPKLMVSITTFQREEAVARSAERFEAFIRKTRLAPYIDMLIVDNGNSAQINQSDKLRLLPNENLGGAGGFARGLIEARAKGASHCLFMDDDAAIHMSSLERTWAFLAYATDPRTAVIGALSSGTNPAILWENGAIFDSSCHPLYNGLDLRDPGPLIAMELETTHPLPSQHYGGWWYFAFPVDHATHMPFPFFVRGDDISFGLANDFNMITLPGVLCFQDMDFSERESPLTLYLDLRSHLVHHLSLPALDIGRWRTARIAAWFFSRSLYPCHYETLAALNLAIEDVLSGPDFFAKNADMVTRRQDITNLRVMEKWLPLSDKELAAGPPKDVIHFNPHSRAVMRLMKLSLNGLFLPFFALYGNRITLPAHVRGAVHLTIGAAHITYWDAARGQSYSVHHSKLRGFGQSLRMTANICRMLWRYPTLKSSWTKGYSTLTQSQFWQKRLGGSMPANGKHR